MTSAGIPRDLIDALEALAKQPCPPPETFERVARWRRACGDADAAATWQTWSLVPPETEELCNALAGLWRNLGDIDTAADLLNGAGLTSNPVSWQKLALLLERADLEGASDLQDQLLLDPPVLTIPELLDLLRLWKQQQQPKQALDLLKPLVEYSQKNGDTPSTAMCNAMADLLEQLKRFDEAESWWQRSHALQPQQVWPLMRLGYQAMRKQQPAVALHYARQVLERDPTHEFAPRLQRKALTGLEAMRSLALLDGQPLSALNNASGGNQPEPEWWDGCTSLALIGFDNTSLLSSWFGYLNSLDPSEPCHQTLELWLIGSPDPLWLEQKAEHLLAPLPQPVLISSWPIWDDKRHGEADKKLEAIDEPPFWRVQVQS